MPSTDHVLEAYIKKLMEIDMGLDDHSLPLLSDKQLEEIALNSGMTADEYHAFLAQAHRHFTDGKKHLELYNYESAKEAFHQCISKFPNHYEATYLLAKSYFHLGLLQQDKSFFDHCDLYIQRCLRLKPSYAPAIELIALKQHELKSISNSGRTKKRIVFIAALTFVAIIGISYFNINNTILELEENVNSAQAQLEAVYQRQSDLIIRIEQFGSNDNTRYQEQLTHVMLIHQSIYTDKNTNNNQLRVELGKQLSELAAQFTESQDNDLAIIRDEIEGSINRIYVEQRNYNKTVRAHNQTVQKFPHSLLGYSKKEYIKNGNTTK